MGGGVLLITVMASYFPPQVLIPLHGLIQLGSNLSRSILNYTAIQWKIGIAFGIGAAVGAGLGSQVVVSLPEREFKLILAVFILVMTWMPKLKSAPDVPGRWYVIGGVASFLALFVGATGPFIAPFYLREKMPKQHLVATKALCQVFTHTMKVIVFFSLGFAIGNYLPLMAMMLVAVFFGNWCGKFLMGKLSEKAFKWIFRVLITGLAGRMIYGALVMG